MELLRELQERFADAPGLIDAKKLQKDTGYVSLFYFLKITILAKYLKIIRLYALRNYSSATGIFTAWKRTGVSKIGLYGFKPNI